MDTEKDRRASIAGLIASHGFAVNSIGYGACSEPGCHCSTRERHPWTYTVGLSLRDQPELVLMGLEPGPAHFAISWVADERRARRLVPAEEPFLLDGVPAKLIAVPDEWLLWDPDRMAAWFLLFEDVSDLPLPQVQQLVWPDADGRLPDEDGCDVRVVRQQPILRDAPRGYPRRWVEPRQARHRRTRR